MKALSNVAFILSTTTWLGASATGPMTEADQSKGYLLDLIATSSPRSTVPADFDCAWRKLAYNYGKKLQPSMLQAQKVALFEALEL